MRVPPKSTAPQVVIVGAGPTGIRAAERFVKAGLRPVVIDEGDQCGGQIYRQPPAVLRRPVSDLYGFEASRAAAIHQTFERLRVHIDYRPRSALWHVEGRTLHVLQEGVPVRLMFDALILATGATERVMPFAGWTLPGVFTLGAAQIALKAQATLLGPRIILSGTGPLLYLVAWQYQKSGAQIVAVLDEATSTTRWHALPKLLSRPAVVLKGAWMVAALRLAGVPVHQGARLIRAHGEAANEGLQALTWRDARGQVHTTACDAMAFGHGLRSENQAADLAGCAFEFDPFDQAWQPSADDQGRTSVAGVYVAGDGARVRGADAAELAGTLAACSALQDLSPHAVNNEIADLQKSLRAHDTFREGLCQLSEPPSTWAREVPDELIICRCEEITAGSLRQCVMDTGACEMNRLKALTRLGMGRCQGRMCGPAAARLLADAADVPLHEVGRLRSQPPIKPVPIHAMGRMSGAAADVPTGERDD